MSKSIETKNPESSPSQEKENRWQELEQRMENSKLDQEFQRAVQEQYRNNETLNSVFKYLKEKRSNDKARKFLDEELIVSPKLVNALMEAESMPQNKRREIVNKAVLETYEGYQKDFENDQREPFEIIYQAFLENQKFDQPKYPNELADFINKRVIRTLYAKDMPRDNISREGPDEFEIMAAIILTCKDQDKAEEVAA